MADLIYRRDAIEAVRKIAGVVSPISDDVLLIDKAEAQTELMMMPSASKEGMWLCDSAGEWYCSECGAQAPFLWMSRIQRKSNYCYNCGAEMEKREEDE